MIIDCHTHISQPSSNIKTAEHLEACEKVDACVVLSGRGGGREGNVQLSAYAGEHEKIVGFAVINPLEDKVGLKDVAGSAGDLGLEGAVLYCAEDKFHPAHSRAMRFYEAAEELGLPVFFHNSEPYSSQAVLDYGRPCLLDEIARRFETLKIIVGTMGRPFVSETLCLLAKHENVYADLTVSSQKIWEVYNIVCSAHEAGVMDKLFFGSGYPFGNAGSCIETLLGFNKLLADTNLPTVPREEIRAIIERDTFSTLGIQR